jgi:transposase-like protein
MDLIWLKCIIAPPPPVKSETDVVFPPLGIISGMTIPSYSGMKDLFGEESNAFLLLQHHGIILPQIVCNCGKILYVNVVRMSYRCTNRDCRKEISALKNSFFYKTRLALNQALHLAHLWLCGATADFALQYLGHSSHTIADYFDYFRKLVADSLDTQDFKIGGNGIIVEVDESKFGKRKYHRGHSVEGVWIFGGVERTEERKLFLVQVEDRTAETLLALIERHIHPGSIIYSDLWRGYARIEEDLQMRHYTVNHSVGFVDQDTGVHTNIIEGTWSGVKRKVPVRNRTKGLIDEHLLEFIWRRKNKDDLWNGFLDALKEINYVD